MYKKFMFVITTNNLIFQNYSKSKITGQVCVVVTLHRLVCWRYLV